MQNAKCKMQNKTLPSDLRSATFPFRAGKVRFYDCNASFRLYTDEIDKYITVGA